MKRGKAMRIEELRIGHYFHKEGDARISSRSGRITKIDRVNVTYESPYFKMMLVLKIRKDELTGAYVRRTPSPDAPLYRIVD